MTDNNESQYQRYIGSGVFLLTGLVVMLGLYCLPDTTMYWALWTPGGGTDVSTVDSAIFAGIIGLFTGFLCYLAFDGTIHIKITLVLFVVSIYLAFKTEGVGYCEAFPITLVLGSIICFAVIKEAAATPGTSVTAKGDVPAAADTVRASAGSAPGRAAFEEISCESCGQSYYGEVAESGVCPLCGEPTRQKEDPLKQDGAE